MPAVCTVLGAALVLWAVWAVLDQLHGCGHPASTVRDTHFARTSDLSIAGWRSLIVALVCVYVSPVESHERTASTAKQVATRLLRAAFPSCSIKSFIKMRRLCLTRHSVSAHETSWSVGVLRSSASTPLRVRFHRHCDVLVVFESVVCVRARGRANALHVRKLSPVHPDALVASAVCVRPRVRVAGCGSRQGRDVLVALPRIHGRVWLWTVDTVPAAFARR